MDRGSGTHDQDTGGHRRSLHPKGIRHSWAYSWYLHTARRGNYHYLGT